MTHDCTHRRQPRGRRCRLDCGRLRLERHRGLHEFARSLTGGMLLAVGGVAALGCTVGQGVTGLSTLAAGACLATLATLAGALLALRVEYALTRID